MIIPLSDEEERSKSVLGCQSSEVTRLKCCKKLGQKAYFFQDLAELPVGDVGLSVGLEDEDLGGLGTHCHSGAVGVEGVDLDSGKDTVLGLAHQL